MTRNRTGMVLVLVLVLAAVYWFWAIQRNETAGEPMVEVEVPGLSAHK